MPDDKTTIPTGWQESMSENNWSEGERDAWRVLHDARPGDLVLWADRSVAMEVVETAQDEEGHHILHVDKPRGEGTYEVHERYHEGRPKFSSPIGRANNLHFVERAAEPRGLSKDECAALVERLSENAVDAFVRLDYGEWREVVLDVVEEWADDVSFLQWKGYKHHPDWEDGDPDAIFASVVEHGTYEAHDEESTQREQAEVALFEDVFREGRELAEASLITSRSDYEDTVEKLAHHTLDRYDRLYDNARTATVDTIGDYVADREPVAQQSIIEHGTDRFDDGEYAELTGDEEVQERAYDKLDADVWERVQQHQRDRGEHDPTVRGLTYTNYRDLVDMLVEEAMRRHGETRFLRTTVKHVVKNWADEVEAREWAGHRHRVYTAGDVEDIFNSVTIHAEADPLVFNPFSRHKERKMAVNALIPEVLDEADAAVEAGELPAPAVEADRYLNENLDMDDISFADLNAADAEELREFLDTAMEAVDGSEVGWTFVEEILASNGAVPSQTNDWRLIDYGVIRHGDPTRKLAWFSQETGDLLILTGRATATVDDLADGQVDIPYGDFHVQRIAFGADEPEFLLTDAPLEEALEFVYDFVDADRADVRLIETPDDIYIQESIDVDDINAGGVLDALVPNLGITSDDVTALAGSATKGSALFVRRFWPEISGVATLAAIISGHWVLAAGGFLGTNIKPNFHKRKGVGVKASREFGVGTREAGVGGEVDMDLHVRNETFSRLLDNHAPTFIRYGLNEGDLGKGAVASAGESLDTFRDTFAYSYEDDTVPKIKAADLDTLSEQELRDLAREADRDFESEGAWGDPEQLRKKVYGYAEYYEPERTSWGQAFLDEYGNSIERLEAILTSGTEDAMVAPSDQKEFNSQQNVGSVGEVDDAIEEEVNIPIGEYDPDNFSWDDLRRTKVGISGILLRGLEAEDVVSTADYLNVDRWLGGVMHNASERVRSKAPTFEEWQNSRYGPGQPAGPEEEARRMARFHKRLARARDPPDPSDVLGYIRDKPDDLGDYNPTNYDFDDTLGSTFDRVAEKFTSNEPVADTHEAEDGHE